MSTETELQPDQETTATPPAADVSTSDVATQPEAASPENAAAAAEPNPQPSRLRKWGKRLAIACGVLVLLAGIGGAYAWHKMKEFDAQHAEFLGCGKTINNFLGEYAASVKAAHKSGSPDAMLANYSEKYASPARGSWKLNSGEDIGDVDYFTLEKLGEADFDHKTLGEEFADYLAGMTDVSRVKCKINLIEDATPEESATLTVKYILDGKDHAGKLFQDRFFFRWWIEREEGSDGLDVWRITKDEFVEGVRVAGSGHGFERVSPHSIGIDFVHQRNPKLDVRKPEIEMQFAVVEHASGGVTAYDYDQDGRADLFFPDGVQSRLYRNTGVANGQPQFEDVTDKAGLTGLDQAHCGIFADFDNDGDKDLFVTRYLAKCCLYENQGDNTFKDVAESRGLDFVEPCMSACLLDFDKDGYLDIYVAVNGNAFKAAPDIPFYSTNAEPNRLFRNVDGKKFEDVTKSSGTGDKGWTLAVTAGDYNNDGRTDLILANDFGRKVVYRNNGDGTFTDMAKDARMLDFSGGMGVAMGDINDDGVPDVYTSNINSNQRWFGEDITIRQYMNNIVRTKYIWDELDDYIDIYRLLGSEWNQLGQMVGDGNSLFRNDGTGTFTELHDSHTHRAGWSWGVGFLDMDNDTDLDIFAANGWISGKKKDDL